MYELVKKCNKKYLVDGFFIGNIKLDVKCIIYRIIAKHDRFANSIKFECKNSVIHIINKLSDTQHIIIEVKYSNFIDKLNVYMLSEYKCINAQTVKNAEVRAINAISDRSIHISKIKIRILESLFDFEKSYLKKQLDKKDKALRKFINKSEKNICNLVCELMVNRYEITKHTVDNNNDKLFNIIIKWGEYNKIYKRMSTFQMKRGLIAGIYMDMLVILENPSLIGLRLVHLQLENDILNGLSNLFITDQINESPIRFTFLEFLFRMYTYSDILNIIFLAIKSMSINVHNSYGRQIGFKKTNRIDNNGNNVISIIYYVQKGLLGNIQYNPKVTRNINNHFFKNDKHKIQYAIHFINDEDGQLIWNNKLSRRAVKLRRKVTKGSICKFDKAILASPINKTYNIYTFNKSCGLYITNKLSKGIPTKNMLNYDRGLIIDLQKLYDSYLTSGYINGIQINECNIVLIHYDIPRSCLVDFIYRKDFIT